MSTQNSSEEGMNIDEQTLLSSQELVDGLLDINLVELPNIRVKDGPWKEWTDHENKIMMDHINFHRDCIEFYNKCWASGPITEKPPRKPDSDVEN